MGIIGLIVAIVAVVVIALTVVKKNNEKNKKHEEWEMFWINEGESVSKQIERFYSALLQAMYEELPAVKIK